MFATALLAIAATTANAGFEDANLKTVTSFDGYTDASELGEDILPSSMSFVEGSFLAGSDGVTRAVLQVDYLEGAWIVVTEDDCTGAYSDGCLSGYVIEAVAVMDAIRLGEEATRHRVQLYANEKGMKHSGTLDISSELDDGEVWLSVDTYDAVGVMIDSDETTVDDDPSAQGAKEWGGAIGLAIGAFFGEIPGAALGYAVGKDIGEKVDEYLEGDGSDGSDGSDDAGGDDSEEAI